MKVTFGRFLRERPLDHTPPATHHQGMKLTASNLVGKLLIAMPGMGDPRFDHSVIYMCAHSEDGAMGLIVNKPTPELRISGLLEQLKIAPGHEFRDIRVHFGGPVETGRGFVLHSSDYQSGKGTLRVDDSVGMTATLDVLEDIAQGRGPQKSLLALGYSGWGPGQLEHELAANAWLTADPRPDILFGRANDLKWTAALKVLGVDPLTLSAAGGRA